MSQGPTQNREEVQIEGVEAPAGSIIFVDGEARVWRE